MSQPARQLVPATDDVGDYVRTTFERFERVLLTATVSFAEPRAPRDVDRALVHLEALVEMLTGLAVGISVGHISAAIRRSFGEAARAEIAPLLAAMLREPAPAIVPVPVSVSSMRPFVGELVGRLQPRLCHHAGMATRMLRTIIDALGSSAVQPAALAMTVRLLREDDASALAFAQHVHLGWQHYVAVISGAAQPAPAQGAWRVCGEAWQTWSQRIRFPAGAPTRVLTQSEIAAEGFVMRIG